MDTLVSENIETACAYPGYESPRKLDELRKTEYKRLGEYDRAATDYKQAIALDPNYADAYLVLGNFYYLNLPRLTEALWAYERYLELAGEQADPLMVERVEQIRLLLDRSRN